MASWFVSPIVIPIFFVAAYMFYRMYITSRVGREPGRAPIFSLQDSAFGDFLYAPIGEEENGMVLTTLSALARIGVDPWQESARLSKLPIEAATQRLTSMISGLSNGRWARSDAGTIAARLIALLPAQRVLQAPSHGTAWRDRAHSHRAYRVAVFAFFVVFNTTIFFVLRSHDSSPVIEPSPVIDNNYSATSTTPTPPEAPLADSK
jgi:hypothetical protein